MGGALLFDNCGEALRKGCAGGEGLGAQILGLRLWGFGVGFLAGSWRILFDLREVTQNECARDPRVLGTFP
jgi:hypothetical protein